jgi:hypothetical protein
MRQGVVEPAGREAQARGEQRGDDLPQRIGESLDLLGRPLETASARSNRSSS